MYICIHVYYVNQAQMIMEYTYIYIHIHIYIYIHICVSIYLCWGLYKLAGFAKARWPTRLNVDTH